MRSGPTFCRLGCPSRKMIRSTILSAWCISSMDSARSFLASFAYPQSSSSRKCSQYWLTAPSSRNKASLSRSIIRSSPFMTQAPVLAAQTSHAVQEWYDLGFPAAEAAMVVLGYPNDRFHHIWEAAATAAALAEGVIDFRRHDELPRIGLEELEDRALDLLLRDDVAMTNQHAPARWAARLAGRPG